MKYILTLKYILTFIIALLPTQTSA